MKGYFSKRSIGRIVAGLMTATITVSLFAGYVKADEEELVTENAEAAIVEEADNVDVESIVDNTETIDSEDVVADAEPVDGDNIVADSELAEEEIIVSESDSDDIELLTLSNVTKNGVTYTANGSVYTASSFNATYGNSVNIVAEIDGAKVTAIAANFLYNIAADSRKNITSVTIPYTIETIGENAFRECTGLSYITWGTEESRDSGFYSNLVYTRNLRSIGKNAFYGDSALTSLGLSGRGTNNISIAAGAFSGCSGMKNIVLPGTVTYIGLDAFDNCTSIENLTYGGNETNWLSINFDGNTKGTHPNAYVSGNISFTSSYYNYNYKEYETYTPTEITLPSGTTTLKPYIFAGFRQLQTIDLSNVVTVGEGAFYNCSKLTQVNLASVNTINDYAFYNCSELSTVTSLSKLSRLGKYAFCGDEKLKTISLESGLGAILEGTFKNCSMLNDISVHSNITSIASDAFDGCNNLKSVSVYFNSVAATYFNSRSDCWVKYIDGVKDNNLDSWLVGYSALFNGEIGMNFYFSKSGVNLSTDYVKFVVPSENGSKDETRYFKDATEKNGQYVMTIYIDPKFASKEIGVKVVIGGEGKGDLHWISFVNYTEVILSAPNAYIDSSKYNVSNVTGQVQALLTYCDAAEKYFDVDAGSISSKYLTTSFNAVSTRFAMSSGFGEDHGYVGMTLSTDSTLTLRLYFIGEQNIDVVFDSNNTSSNFALSKYAKCYYDGVAYTIVEIKGYNFAAITSDMNQLGLGRKLNIVYDGKSSTDIFCGMSYLYQAQNSSNEKLAYLAKAAYNVYSCVLGNTDSTDYQVVKK